MAAGESALLPGIGDEGRFQPVLLGMHSAGQ